MLINLICALDKNRGIGINNTLPWNIKEDLKRFKDLTTGHFILMGRKTYQSIGRPLPNRHNLVLTKSRTPINGVTIVNSLQNALDAAHEAGAKELFVIGGEFVYKETIDIADRLYLTIVQDEYIVDTYFPRIDASVWHVDSIKENEENGIRFLYKNLSRIR